MIDMLMEAVLFLYACVSICVFMDLCRDTKKLNRSIKYRENEWTKHLVKRYMEYLRTPSDKGPRYNEGFWTKWQHTKGFVWTYYRAKHAWVCTEEKSIPYLLTETTTNSVGGTSYCGAHCSRLVYQHGLCRKCKHGLMREFETNHMFCFNNELIFEEINCD